MRKLIPALIIVFALVGGLAETAAALDVETYVKYAKKTLRKAKRSKVHNVEKLIDQQKLLIRLSIEASLEYAEKNPSNAKIMNFLVLNSVKIQNLARKQIVDEWFKGGYLNAHGVDISQFSVDDEIMILYRAMIFPASAISSLKEYQKSEDPELLGLVFSSMEAAIENVEKLK